MKSNNAMRTFSVLISNFMWVFAFRSMRRKKLRWSSIIISTFLGISKRYGSINMKAPLKIITNSLKKRLKLQQKTITFSWEQFEPLLSLELSFKSSKKFTTLHRNIFQRSKTSKPMRKSTVFLMRKLKKQ